MAHYYGLGQNIKAETLRIVLCTSSQVNVCGQKKACRFTAKFILVQSKAPIFNQQRKIVVSTAIRVLARDMPGTALDAAFSIRDSYTRRVRGPKEAKNFHDLTP